MSTKDKIQFDNEKILASIEKEGKFEEDKVLIKKWEGEEGTNHLIAKIDLNNNHFIGVLNAVLEKDGYAFHILPNGDRYLGYYVEDQRESHGIYQHSPVIKGNTVHNEFYYGRWKDDEFTAKGVYLWLQEKKNVKSFSNFDDSSFDAIVGDVEDGKFVFGTLMQKIQNDYYVYHGKFDKNLKKKGEKGFYYSASSDQLLYGKFDNNEFVSGYVALFNEEGLIKDFLKDQGNNKITFEEDLPEKEKADIKKIMTTFRNVILERDYFGDLYQQFGKSISFMEKEMKSIDIFNSDNYFNILSVTTGYNKINIFSEIEKKVEYH